MKTISSTKRKDGLFDESLDSEEESIPITYVTLVPTMKLATKVEHINKLSLKKIPSIYYLHSNTMQFPSPNILQAHEWIHSRFDC
jgi:hypothetical protein